MTWTNKVLTQSNPNLIKKNELLTFPFYLSRPLSHLLTSCLSPSFITYSRAQLWTSTLSGLVRDEACHLISMKARQTGILQRNKRDPFLPTFSGGTLRFSFNHDGNVKLLLCFAFLLCNRRIRQSNITTENKVGVNWQSKVGRHEEGR